MGKKRKPETGQYGQAAEKVNTGTSFNFFKGCSNSARPDWVVGVACFKIPRRPVAPAKNGK